MRDVLIVVCDDTPVVFGQRLFQASSYLLDDVARAAGTDPLDLREALLVMGGEAAGPHPLGERELARVLGETRSVSRHYDEDEQESLEKAVSAANQGGREVYCSFSLFAPVDGRLVGEEVHLDGVGQRRPYDYKEQ